MFMRTILLLFFTLSAQLIFAQTETMFQQGQFQITLAFSLSPVHKKDAPVDFKYVDGNRNSPYPVDTVSAQYHLKKRYFGNAFTLGVGYFLTQNIRASFQLKPHLNSFLPNRSKNGKVYGVQFDVGLDYFHTVSNEWSVSFGTTASRIIGGFGITSSGPKNKEYLVVNGNNLYDSDIGFHIIDNSWALGPKLGIHYQATHNIVIAAQSGFQMTFGRQSRMNFAGLLQDGSVKWNRKEFDDTDVTLLIDNTKITNKSIHHLPYQFSGLFFEVGTLINLRK